MGEGIRRSGGKWPAGPVGPAWLTAGLAGLVRGVLFYFFVSLFSVFVFSFLYLFSFLF